MTPDAVFQPRNAAELRDHYAAVKRRLNPIPAGPVRPEAPVLTAIDRAIITEELAALDPVPDELLKSPSSYASVARQIFSDICSKHLLDPVALLGGGRTTPLNRARQECAHLLRRHTPWSTSHIARFMRRGDHSSIIYSLRQYAARNGVPVAQSLDGGTYAGI